MLPTYHCRYSDNCDNRAAMRNSSAIDFAGVMAAYAEVCLLEILTKMPECEPEAINKIAIFFGKLISCIGLRF